MDYPYTFPSEQAVRWQVAGRAAGRLSSQDQAAANENDSDDWTSTSKAAAAVALAEQSEDENAARELNSLLSTWELQFRR